MSRMIRKQVYIAAEHDAFLKQRARELGVTEADLIRQGIEQLRRAPAEQYQDEQAWREERAFIEERARMPEHGGRRQWTRDELYDERA
jgi:hypothetical protein